MLHAILEEAFDSMPLPAVYNNQANRAFLSAQGIPALKGTKVDLPNWQQNFSEMLKSHSGLKV